MLVRPSEPHVLSVIFLMSSVLQRVEDNGFLSHLHKASQPFPLPMSCDPNVPCSSGSLFRPRLGSVFLPAFQGGLWSSGVPIVCSSATLFKVPFAGDVMETGLGVVLPL